MRRIDKVIKVCLSLLMIFMLCGQSISEIFAKTVVMDRDTAMSSYMSVKEHSDNLGAYHPAAGKRVFKIDGKYAYCIESDVGISEDRVYQDGNNPEDILENGRQNVLTTWYEKYNMISALLTMVPSQINSDTKSEHIKWLVGQTMIWEITGEERDWQYIFKGPTRSGAMAYRDTYAWDITSDKQAFDNFYKEVEGKMLKYWDIPSFTRNQVSSAKTYDLDKYDGTYYYTTLTDTKDVLGNYDFNASGFTFTKNGNQLTVKTTTPITDTVTIQTKPSSALKMRSPIFWTDGSAQKTVTCGEVEDPSPFAYFKMKLGVGNFNVTKQDDYTTPIAGAVFDITDPHGNVKTYTTDSNGKISVIGVIPGQYKVKEKSAPNGYLVNNQTFTLDVTIGNTASVTIFNDEPVGKINITKTSENNDKVAGAKFNVIADGNILSANGKVLYPSGSIVDTVISGVNGIATTKEIPLGNYKVIEVEVPQGYLLNTSEFKVSLKYANQNTPVIIESTTVINKEPTGTIELKKEIDSSVTDGQLGDVFLSSIEYGLYAKNDIKNVAGTKVFYTKDQLIALKQVDKEGKMSWGNLPMGNYYLKELKTNNSLLIDNNPIDVTLNYKDMHTAHITVKMKTSDMIASQRIQIFKEGIKDGEAGIVPGLKGAEFTFVLNSDYEKVGYDKAKKYFIGVTDENGYLTTSRLPYGVYRVKETKTPEGYYGTSDFLISVEKDSSLYEIGYQIKKVTVNNVPFESLLKIVKKDKDTNKVILKAGATFKVKNLDTNEYVSYIDWSCFPNIVVDQWTTHEDGSITLNTMLKKGRYQLEEIKAPDGYLVSEEPLIFVINEEKYDISSDGKTPITTVDFKDEAVMGQVLLEKKGEVLTGYKDGQFIYQLQGLKGAKFEIYAKEDILSPSGDKSILYKQGELVDTIISDKDGKAVSKKIPLGKYNCKEVEVPYGYVLDKEIKTFSLSYKDQVTAIIYENLNAINDRQKVQVLVGKKDQESLEYLDGAELTLIANKDIYNYLGEKIVSAGTVIEKIESSKKGLTYFNSDLPIDLDKESIVQEVDEDIECIGRKDAMFLVKETKQPDGYLSKKVHYYIDTSYTNSHQEVISYQYNFLNKQTHTEIHKLDTESLLEISGAKLQVIDAITKEVIDEWVSDGLGHVMKGLIIDRNYILHEVESPVGYQLAPDIEFNIRDLDEIQHISFMNSKVQVLGDEPVITQDYTIFWTYIVMVVGAITIIFIIRKRED
ncbi:MAG: SpaA isopeptide-forming pilin-related protein [Coprobacillus sp.]